MRWYLRYLPTLRTYDRFPYPTKGNLIASPHSWYCQVHPKCHRKQGHWFLLQNRDHEDGFEWPFEIKTQGGAWLPPRREWGLALNCLDGREWIGHWWHVLDRILLERVTPLNKANSLLSSLLTNTTNLRVYVLYLNILDEQNFSDNNIWWGRDFRQQNVRC